ncbi:MAG: hypothetical protein HZB16_06080 [Armatimonadetes bacterium]|nr:hypothetical protein [Armatimonadota bacterium]
MMTPLLEGELDSSTQESVRARIEADPVLAGELRRLELAVGSLHRFAPRAVPAELREDLELGLMLEAKPLRARYGELLDGSLRPREAAALRAEIAADHELAGEFSLLSAGLETWRAEAPAPVPAHVRAGINRAVDFEATRHIVPIPSRLPLLRQRFAMAGAVAVMLFGFIVARVGERPGTPVTPVVPTVATSLASTASPTAPVVEAPKPTPAVAAPVAAEPVPVAQPSEPSRSRRAAKTSVERHPKIEAPSQGHRPDKVQPPPPPPVTPHSVLATPVVLASATESGTSIQQGSMPDPSTLNSVEAGVSSHAINFASETREPGFE